MAACFAVALFLDVASTGFGVALAAYTILAQDSRRAGLVSVVVGYALIVLAHLTLPGTTLGGLFFDAFTFAMVIAIAELVRTRRAYAEIYAERAAALESEKVAATRRAVDDERLRIARELHDVVAHSVTSIAVQSSVGLDRLRQRPDAAEQALATIETSSRTALAEMRRMLGMLRHSEEGSAQPRAGARSGATSGHWWSEYVAAGISTSLTVDGDRPPLVPPGVDLTRLPDRAGGAHQRRSSTRRAAQADVGIRLIGRRCASCEVRDDGHGPAVLGPGRRRPGPRPRSACASGSACTAARSTAGPRPRAASGAGHLPFDAPRPDAWPRRRTGRRHDPRGGGRRPGPGARRLLVLLVDRADDLDGRGRGRATGARRVDASSASSARMSS